MAATELVSEMVDSNIALAWFVCYHVFYMYGFEPGTPERGSGGDQVLLLPFIWRSKTAICEMQ